MRLPWSPDNGTPRGHRKRKKKVDPAAILSQKKYRLKLKVGAKLRDALGRLRKLEQKYKLSPTEITADDENMLQQLRAEVNQFRDELRRIEVDPFPASLAKFPTEKAEPPATLANAILQEPQAKLTVPLPIERIVAQDLMYPSREGQADFRCAIIAAYGCCAATGCNDEAVLQAAHIIPYVDARSHLITNGLCLRADIHLLFDRGLLVIADDCSISISPVVKALEYRQLDGRKLRLPANLELHPDPVLLRARNKIIGRGG